MEIQEMEDDSSDILQPATEKQLETMLIRLAESLPNSIRGHHFLYGYLKKFRPDKIAKFGSDIPGRCGKIVYVPKNGRPENCTYISVSAVEDYWIFLYTLEESGGELAECLQKTNRISWECTPIFVSVEYPQFELVDKILHEKNSQWTYDKDDNICYLPKEVARRFTFRIPDGTYLAPLEQAHAEFINRNWPHSYQSSLKLLRFLIQTNGGTGLFELKSNELIAWVGTNDYFAPGFWHTLDKERGRGCGSAVYKHECKRFVENYDLDILALVVDGNTTSKTILDKLGFQVVQKLKWIERL